MHVKVYKTNEIGVGGEEKKNSCSDILSARSSPDHRVLKVSQEVCQEVFQNVCQEVCQEVFR